MAKQNKVCSNLQQDFDNTEKKQARTNIDASQINYVDALPGHQPTSEVGDLFVVEYESGKHFNDGNGNIGVRTGIREYRQRIAEYRSRRTLDEPAGTSGFYHVGPYRPRYRQRQYLHDYYFQHYQPLRI